MDAVRAYDLTLCVVTMTFKVTSSNERQPWAEHPIAMDSRNGSGVLMDALIRLMKVCPLERS
jgi:hypothetical protein